MDRKALLDPQRSLRSVLTVSTTIPNPIRPGTSVTAHLRREFVAPSYLPITILRFDLERRRVEAFLAAFEGFRVPISAEWRIFGQPRHFRVLPLTHESPCGLGTSSQSWDLAVELRGLYRRVDRLLDLAPRDSPVGHAIENIGRSALDEDADSAFLHVWNGIELLGKDYWIRSHPPGSGLRPDGTRKNLKAAEVVPPLVREFFDGEFRPDVDRLVDLRNAVAHGGIGTRPESTLPSTRSAL